MSVLAQLTAASGVDTLDARLAATLMRLVQQPDEVMALVCAMTSQRVRQGHVCLELAGWLASDPESLCDTPAAEPIVWPSAATVRKALARSALVARALPGEPTPCAHPLVWDGDDRVYLQRYFAHEASLVQHVHTRPGQAPREASDPALVERLFPPGQRDEQRAAALGALTRKLCILTGGPGTGKTSTVVRLLALYLAPHAAHGRPPRVRLLAPTGKAAARMMESIEGALGGLPIDDALRARIPRKAETLHRALGMRPGKYAPRHGPDNPLDADLVIVDEASMIDLSAMRRLFDATPPEAPIILLGDPHQLASVEAGSALSDLCAAARAGAPALAGSLFELRTSHRYAPGSGIAALAEACKAGDVERALATLRPSADMPDLRHVPTGSDGSLPRPLLRALRDHYADLKKRAPGEQLTAIEGFRVLCAHRRGPLGAEHINREAAQRFGGALGELRADYHGRPILVTENDPALELYNGDVGVVSARTPKAPLRAYFPRTPEPREVSLAQLPAHEDVYAMSVHKSQGSEFDHVAIVLPEQASPVLSRELLYTAVTRARKSVTLYASEAVLRHTLEQRVQRASGLVQALAVRG